MLNTSVLLRVDTGYGVACVAELLGIAYVKPYPPPLPLPLQVKRKVGNVYEKLTQIVFCNSTLL